MPYKSELETAKNLARVAGEIQLSHFMQEKKIEIKSDTSPVTFVDKQCEEIIKNGIEREFPEDGFLGEESGDKEGRSGRKWIVDPLDGTRPYIKGIPTYSCLIALLDNNIPVVGVMFLPSMDEMYYAAKGTGAKCNDMKIKVSDTSDMSHAMGSEMGIVFRPGTREARKLYDLACSWDYMYGFMDAYTYACVAGGRVDLCVNLLDKAWDCAAAAAIIKEAGGAFSDLQGNETVFSGNFIISNGKLHDKIIRHFNS